MTAKMARTGRPTNPALSDAERLFISHALHLIVTNNLDAFSGIAKSPVFKKEALIEGLEFYNPSAADIPENGLGDVDILTDHNPDNEFEFVRIKLNPRPSEGIRLVIIFERNKGGGGIKYINMGDEELNSY